MCFDEIVFLDDGIRTGKLDVSQNVQKFVVMEDGTILHREDEENEFVSHATVCAAILNTFANNIRIFDLKVLNDDGEGTAERVKKALEWCLEKQKYFIHMSIGTINYHYYQIFATEIKKLIQNGGVIVAAFHNWNVRTFPASVPGVIGVRKDRYSVLGDGEYLCQKNWGLNDENSLVVSGNYIFRESVNKEIYTYGANSYAVPIMAGTIIQLNKTVKIKSLVHLIKVLKKHAQEISYPEKIRDTLENNKDSLPLVVYTRLDEKHLQN